MALCAGVGGLERGIESLIPNTRTVCYVEGETYPASVLASKMEAGSLPKAPIWSNVRTFDGNPWRGKVSILSGGFPCQPYSTAGKQLADKDPRDLWPDFARIIGEVRPEFIFLENVANVVKWALPTVLEDLSEMGYDAAWCVVGASEVGAPHRRNRWFLFAHTNSKRRNKKQYDLWSREFDTARRGIASNSNSIGRRKNHGEGKSKFINKNGKEWGFISHTNNRHFNPKEKICTGGNASFIGSWWKIEPPVDRVADGVADWVHRMRACGNGVVPQQAAYAYSILIERCGFMVSKS